MALGKVRDGATACSLRAEADRHRSAVLVVGVVFVVSLIVVALLDEVAQAVAV